MNEAFLFKMKQRIFTIFLYKAFFIVSATGGETEAVSKNESNIAQHNMLCQSLPACLMDSICCYTRLDNHNTVHHFSIDSLL